MERAGKGLEKAGKGWNVLESAKEAGQGCKWLENHRNGRRWLELAGDALRYFEKQDGENLLGDVDC